MKRTTYLVQGLGVAAIVTLLLSLWSGSSVVVPQVLANNNECSNATLSGSYAALYQGSISNTPQLAGAQPGGGYIPVAAVIVVKFDGGGRIQASSGGAIATSGTERFFNVIGGNYSVNSDCIGTLTFFTDIPRPFLQKIIVTGNGEEYRFLRTTPTGAPVAIIQSGTARRMDLAPVL